MKDVSVEQVSMKGTKIGFTDPDTKRFTTLLTVECSDWLVPQAARLHWKQLTYKHRLTMAAMLQMIKLAHGLISGAHEYAKRQQEIKEQHNAESTE